MALKLKETSEILGSSDSEHKMAVFWELMSYDQLTTLMMEAAGSSETLLVRLYQCTRHCLPGDIILHCNRRGKNRAASVYGLID